MELIPIQWNGRFLPFILMKVYMNRDDIIYEWSFNRINSSVDDTVINLNSDSTCVSESLVGLSKK